MRALVVIVAAALGWSNFAGASTAAAQPPPGTRCGLELDAPRIANAVQLLEPAFRDIDAPWDSVAYGGNFDPCATLSTALVSVERATGSSPAHALLFHYGDYVGTATTTPYPFTSLNTAQTTADTVVLDYKDGRFVCTACAGPVYTVRYQWADGHVQPRGLPPPAP